MTAKKKYIEHQSGQKGKGHGSMIELKRKEMRLDESKKLKRWFFPLSREEAKQGSRDSVVTRMAKTGASNCRGRREKNGP